MPTTPDIRVKLQPEGQDAVIGALRKVQNEAQRAGQVSAGAFNALGASVAALTRLLPALSFAAALSSIAAFTRGAISAASDLDDLAEKTGASVEELSKLKQQADISGAAMETVETALVRLAKGLNGTDEESQKTTRALAALGLEASKLRNLDTAEALKVVAQRMNEFADGSGKTALAMDLFGRSGAQVLPFLKDLANDQALAARVTAEQAAKAEELEKGIRRLGNEFRVAAQELTLQLVPGMLRFVQAANDARELSISFGARFAFANPFTSINEALNTTRKRLAEAIEAKEKFFARTGVNTQAQLDEIAQLQRDLEFFKRIQARDALSITGTDTAGERQRFGLKGAKPILDYASATDDASKTVKESAGRFEDYAMRVQAAVANAINNNDVVRAKELAKQIEALDSLFFDSGLDADIYEAALKKLTGAHDNLAEQAKIAAEELRKQQALVEEGKRIFEETRTPIERLASTFSNLQKLLDAGAIDPDTFARATFKAQDDFDKLNAKSGHTFSEMQEFAMQAARNIQNTMSDALFNIGESGQNLAFTFTQTIRKMLADVLAAKANIALFGADFAKTGELGGFAASAAKFFGFGAAAGGLVEVPAIAAHARLLAEGGKVSGPGSGTSDSIPAWLSNGEFVVRSAAVAQPGILPLLQAINQGMNLPAVAPIRRLGFGFADGGLVDAAGARASLDSSLTVGLSDGLVLRHLESPEGQRVLVKLIGKNKRGVRGALGT